MRKLIDALTGAVLMAACIFLRPLLRPWYAKWGATKSELVQTLPGDDSVTDPGASYTQAISIQASATAIWPWLVQTGQGKGGFYSYELLENIVGCQIHNVTRILPEHQDIKIGDGLLLHPDMPAIPVAIIEPEKTLVYGGRVDKATANVWIFSLNQQGPETRLVTRWMFEYGPGFGKKLGYSWLLEPIAAMMQRKMLLTIKKLAEKAAA
jgi:hypothetical protein